MILFRKDDRDAAIPLANEVADSFREALKADPDNFDLLYGLSRAERTRSEILVNSQQGEEAVKAATASLETLDHVRTLLPAETLGWWRAREFSYWRRAYALYSTGHPAEAVDDYYAALKLADQQIALDADDADARENRSIFQAEMAYPLLDPEALQGRGEGRAVRPGMRHGLRELSRHARRRRHRMLPRGDDPAFAVSPNLTAKLAQTGSCHAPRGRSIQPPVHLFAPSEYWIIRLRG